MSLAAQRGEPPSTPTGDLCCVLFFFLLSELLFTPDILKLSSDVSSVGPVSIAGTQ